jgi:hypothetical protein
MNIADATKDVQGNPLVYAGGLTMNRNTIWKSIGQSIGAIAASIPVQAWEDIDQGII